MALGFGLLLLTACYVIARSIYGPQVAAISCGLTALSLPFIYSAHLARWDIMVAALGYTALVVQLSNRGRRVHVRRLPASSLDSHSKSIRMPRFLCR